VSSLREQTENILRSWFGEQTAPLLLPLNHLSFLSHTYIIDGNPLRRRNTLVDAL
jgi:hypothetical protein